MILLEIDYDEGRRDPTKENITYVVVPTYVLHF